ncbi:hypothetical protein BD408DRAFT_421828 [Parasitella parasitica]|nr:hypothetical protein BD408DRAFT_421828 [Parasitella parasitica]
MIAFFIQDLTMLHFSVCHSKTFKLFLIVTLLFSLILLLSLHFLTLMYSFCLMLLTNTRKNRVNVICYMQCLFV